jgi:hypothetical protein
MVGSKCGELGVAGLGPNIGGSVNVKRVIVSRVVVPRALWCSEECGRGDSPMYRMEVSSIYSEPKNTCKVNSTWL